MNDKSRENSEMNSLQSQSGSDSSNDSQYIGQAKLEDQNSLNQIRKMKSILTNKKQIAGKKLERQRAMNSSDVCDVHENFNTLNQQIINEGNYSNQKRTNSQMINLSRPNTNFETTNDSSKIINSNNQLGLKKIETHQPGLAFFNAHEKNPYQFQNQIRTTNRRTQDSLHKHKATNGEPNSLFPQSNLNIPRVNSQQQINQRRQRRKEINQLKKIYTLKDKRKIEEKKYLRMHVKHIKRMKFIAETLKGHKINHENCYNEEDNEETEKEKTRSRYEQTTNGDMTAQTNNHMNQINEIGFYNQPVLQQTLSSKNHTNSISTQINKKLTKDLDNMHLSKCSLVSMTKSDNVANQGNRFTPIPADRPSNALSDFSQNHKSKDMFLNFERPQTNANREDSISLAGHTNHKKYDLNVPSFNLQRSVGNCNSHRSECGRSKGLHISHKSIDSMVEDLISQQSRSAQDLIRKSSKRSLIKRDKQISLKNQRASNLEGIESTGRDQTQQIQQPKFKSCYIDAVIEPTNLFNYNKSSESLSSGSSQRIKEGKIEYPTFSPGLLRSKTTQKNEERKNQMISDKSLSQSGSHSFNQMEANLLNNQLDTNFRERQFTFLGNQAQISLSGSNQMISIADSSIRGERSQQYERDNGSGKKLQLFRCEQKMEVEMENQRTSERYVKQKTQQLGNADNKRPPTQHMRVDRNQNNVGEESKHHQNQNPFNIVDQEYMPQMNSINRNNKVKSHPPHHQPNFSAGIEKCSPEFRHMQVSNVSERNLLFPKSRNIQVGVAQSAGESEFSFKKGSPMNKLLSGVSNNESQSKYDRMDSGSLSKLEMSFKKTESPSHLQKINENDSNSSLTNNFIRSRIQMADGTSSQNRTSQEKNRLNMSGSKSGSQNQWKGLSLNLINCLQDIDREIDRKHGGTQPNLQKQQRSGLTAIKEKSALTAFSKISQLSLCSIGKVGKEGYSSPLQKQLSVAVQQKSALKPLGSAQKKRVSKYETDYCNQIDKIGNKVIQGGGSPPRKISHEYAPENNFNDPKVRLRMNFSPLRSASKNLQSQKQMSKSSNPEKRFLEMDQSKFNQQMRHGLRNDFVIDSEAEEDEPSPQCSQLLQLRELPSSPMNNENQMNRMRKIQIQVSKQSRSNEELAPEKVNADRRDSNAMNRISKSIKSSVHVISEDEGENSQDQPTSGQNDSFVFTQADREKLQSQINSKQMEFRQAQDSGNLRKAHDSQQVQMPSGVNRQSLLLNNQAKFSENQFKWIQRERSENSRPFNYAGQHQQTKMCTRGKVDDELDELQSIMNRNNSKVSAIFSRGKDGAQSSQYSRQRPGNDKSQYSAQQVPNGNQKSRATDQQMHIQRNFNSVAGEDTIRGKDPSYRKGSMNQTSPSNTVEEYQPGKAAGQELYQINEDQASIYNGSVSHLNEDFGMGASSVNDMPQQHTSEFGIDDRVQVNMQINRPIKRVGGPTHSNSMWATSNFKSSLAQNPAEQKHGIDQNRQFGHSFGAKPIVRQAPQYKNVQTSNLQRKQLNLQQVDTRQLNTYSQKVPAQTRSKYVQNVPQAQTKNTELQIGKAQRSQLNNPGQKQFPGYQENFSHTLKPGRTFAQNYGQQEYQTDPQPSRKRTDLGENMSRNGQRESHTSTRGELVKNIIDSIHKPKDHPVIYYDRHAGTRHSMLSEMVQAQPYQQPADDNPSRLRLEMERKDSNPFGAANYDIDNDIDINQMQKLGYNQEDHRILKNQSVGQETKISNETGQFLNGTNNTHSNRNSIQSPQRYKPQGYTGGFRINSKSQQKQTPFDLNLRNLMDSEPNIQRYLSNHKKDLLKEI